MSKHEIEEFIERYLNKGTNFEEVIEKVESKYSKHSIVSVLVDKIFSDIGYNNHCILHNENKSKLKMTKTVIITHKQLVQLLKIGVATEDIQTKDIFYNSNNEEIRQSVPEDQEIEGIIVEG